MLLIGGFHWGSRDVVVPIIFEHGRNGLVDVLPPVLQILIRLVAVEPPSHLQEAIAER
jgi:hypothetical protein